MADLDKGMGEEVILEVSGRAIREGSRGSLTMHIPSNRFQAANLHEARAPMRAVLCFLGFLGGLNAKGKKTCTHRHCQVTAVKITI